MGNHLEKWASHIHQHDNRIILKFYIVSLSSHLLMVGLCPTSHLRHISGNGAGKYWKNSPTYDGHVLESRLFWRPGEGNNQLSKYLHLSKYLIVFLLSIPKNSATWVIGNWVRVESLQFGDGWGGVSLPDIIPSYPKTAEIWPHWDLRPFHPPAPYMGQWSK